MLPPLPRGKPVSLNCPDFEEASFLEKIEPYRLYAADLVDLDRKHERDTGQRDGMTTVEHQRVKELERENKALRRANEIRKLASVFFAQAELDQVLFWNASDG